VFACPDNVFFFKRQDGVWGLVAWQWAQILMLFAQERFGPAFLWGSCQAITLLSLTIVQFTQKRKLTHSVRMI